MMDRIRLLLTLLLWSSLVAISGPTWAQDLDPLEKSWPEPQGTETGLPENWSSPIMEGERFLYLQADRLETGLGHGHDTYNWDAQGWYGNDRHKLWLKTEGHGAYHGGLEEVEGQVLYNRLLTSFWDIQAGIRYDHTDDNDTEYAVLGIQGLAPYWFEVDTAAFLSSRGDLSLRAEFEYEYLLTQRLILQPRLEINAALQDVPGTGTGSGLGNTELGLRLRYEIRREFAPYIGLSWNKSYGDTAAIIRNAGGDSSDLRFVFGLRFWY